MRRPSALRRCVQSALIVLVVAALSARGAQASSRVLPVPAAGETAFDYSATGSRHIILVGSSNSPRRILGSSDAGRTFTQVAQEPELNFIYGVSVEPDGRSWQAGYPAGGGAGARLVGRDPAAPGTPITRTFENVIEVTAPALAHGQRWVAERAQGNPSSLRLHRIDAQAQDLAVIDLGPTNSGLVRLVSDARGLWVLASSQTWLIDASGNAAAVPAFSPDISPLGPSARFYGGRLFVPVSAEVWWATTDATSEEISRVQSVDGGALVYSVSPVAGTLGGPPSIVDRLESYGPRGPLAADTSSMISAANAIRTQQGLPGLIGDPAVSQASRNHAAYDRRWHEAHSETAGRAGYTGASPSQRCSAVGTVCGGEIMHYLRTPGGAVSDWWATPFHRSIVGDPAEVAAGAAYFTDASGSTQVMNGAEGRALMVAPVGLPRGDWPGRVSFGGEIPDPGAPCGMTAPYGTAVTAYSYIEPATEQDWAPGLISLVDTTTGAPVVGCARDQYFVPDEALKPGHTYRVQTTYTTTEGAQMPFSWTFRPTGQADPSSADSDTTLAPRRTTLVRRCVSAASLGRVTRVRVQRGLQVRVRSCRAGKVTVQLRRGSRVVLRRTVTVRASRVATVRLKGRVRPGRYVLRLSATGITRNVKLTVRPR